jgi:hypothetical protein
VRIQTFLSLLLRIFLVSAHNPGLKSLLHFQVLATSSRTTGTNFLSSSIFCYCKCTPPTEQADLFSSCFWRLGGPRWRGCYLVRGFLLVGTLCRALRWHREPHGKWGVHTRDKAKLAFITDTLIHSWSDLVPSLNTSLGILHFNKDFGRNIQIIAEVMKKNEYIWNTI